MSTTRRRPAGRYGEDDGDSTQQQVQAPSSPVLKDRAIVILPIAPTSPPTPKTSPTSSLLHKGDWEGVFQKTTKLSARNPIQYIMDDDDDDDDEEDMPLKLTKKKTIKKKRKKKKILKIVDGSEEEKVTTTKNKSTGAKKKKKSRKKKYPPSVLEPNGSSDCVSALSDGLGSTYQEKVVLEEDKDWWDHLRAACLEDEKTQKRKTPPPQSEATASDTLEVDNAKMALDHLHFLLDRLLEDEGI
jgi:hypothetical protein